MTAFVSATNMGDLYISLLEVIMNSGQDVYIGRTKTQTKEIMGVQLRLEDVRNNVFSHPDRDLNYRFMVAEWLWIMAGYSDLETLIKFNKRMAEFSDNGRTLAGAYGPRLIWQWPYIVDTLRKDRSSRQAVASIWTPNPLPSKDIPCTLTCQFLIRDGKLHGIFNMRSSDAWLGIPYDMFTFCQIVNSLAGELMTNPGSLILNLGSSHLYEPNFKYAEKVISRPVVMDFFSTPRLPGLPPAAGLLSEQMGLFPLWKMYWDILHASGKAEALNILSREGANAKSFAD